MSWTINSTERNKSAIAELTNQINAAATAKILLFCSVSDQGVRNEGTFPADCNRGTTFRIGAATPSGSAWEWIGVNDVDYILPGTGLRVDTRGPSAKGVKPVSGSSLATALASGLAAVILYCVALRDPNDLDRVKGHENMKKILDNINTTGDRTKPFYLQVWDKFDPAKETQISANEDKDRLQSVVTKLMAPLI
jgi:subtilisin family serine protease